MKRILILFLALASFAHGDTKYLSTTGSNFGGNESTFRANAGLAIGTNVQAYSNNLTTWSGVAPGTNVTVFLSTPSGANLASALTSALPASKGGTGITSLGAGVATALGNPTGSTSGFHVIGGGLGTPLSGILTNCTGFPVGNLGGLGTGVSAFLATPSGSNFNAMLTSPIPANAGGTGSSLVAFTGPTVLRSYTLPDASVVLASTTGTETLSNKTLSSPTISGTVAGGHSYSGQIELTGQAATNSTSVMTRALGDTRYGQEYRLVLAADTSASSTTPVLSSESVTLPAGTYRFISSIVTRTASTTGGFNSNFHPSNTSVDDSTGSVNVAIANGDGASNTPAMASRAGANLFQYIPQCNTAGGALLKSGMSHSMGWVTFSSQVTINGRVSQATNDGSNPALMKKGSYIIFTSL